MIRINIKTGTKVQVKSFTNLTDLQIYCRELCLLVSDNYNILNHEAIMLGRKIWNTNVGKSFKTDLGEIISISGKSRAGHVMLGDK